MRRTSANLLLTLLVGMGLFAGESALATTLTEGLTLEQVSEAPWIFLAKVQSVEIVTDGMTPVGIFPKWQAQYTRFKVIRGVKGPFSEGHEVEVKECAPGHLPSQPFCGVLYARAPAAPSGKFSEEAIFLVVTGPGNPRVYDYQTTIRFPAGRVPINPKPKPDSSRPEDSLEEGPMERGLGIPWSDSGFLIDLSRLAPSRSASGPSDDAAASPKGESGYKAKPRYGEEPLLPDLPVARPLRKNVDLNDLVKKLESIAP